MLRSRSLAREDYVVLWLDSAYIQATQFVLCMGATMEGRKRVLGFVAATLEDAVRMEQWLQELIARGMRSDHGVVCVMPGTHGLRKALDVTFGASVQIQRCQVQ